MRAWRSLTSWLTSTRMRAAAPVPYINAWGTPGVQGRAKLAPDPNTEGKLSVFLADVKEEGPDFKQQNPQRQRECYAQGLCQVCARPVDPDDRYLVISPRSVEYVDIEDAKRPVTNEPWVDRQCGDFAMTYCPGLLRQGADVRLEKAPLPGSYTTIFQTGTTPEARDRPVVFYIKITLDG